MRYNKVKYIALAVALLSFLGYVADASANVAGYNKLKQCYIAHIAMYSWYNKFSPNYTDALNHERKMFSLVLDAASAEASYLGKTSDQVKSEFNKEATEFVFSAEQRFDTTNARGRIDVKGMAEFFESETAVCAKWLQSQ